MDTDIVVTIDRGRHLTRGDPGGVSVGHQRAAASGVVSVQGPHTVAQLLESGNIQPSDWSFIIIMKILLN